MTPAERAHAAIRRAMIARPDPMELKRKIQEKNPPRKIRLPVPSLTSGDGTLDAAASHYLITVRRLRVGDEFVAFDPIAQREADAVLLDERARGAGYRLQRVRPAEKISQRRVTVIQALAKAQKLDRVVSDATALGATRLLLVATERSVPHKDSEWAHRRRRWLAIASDAARQSGRGDLPRIDGPCSLSEALSKQCREASLRFLLDRSAPVRLAEALAGSRSDSEVALLIGPEGGLTPEEQTLALESGFVPASLGPFVLRTELVPAVSLGVLLGYGDGSDKP
jgi:16S rRNA (uracil1498-N3)-methyltransferase